MIQILKMAFRDLGRNRRRSALSALALGVGVSLLLLMSSVLTGEMRGSMDASIKLQSGHLQVRSATYNEDRTSLAWEDLVEEPDTLAAQIASLPPVKAATPRLFASGIVAEGDEAVGVRIVGIVPDSTASDPFRSGVISGDYLKADDREGILIGQPLAKKVNLKAGGQVTLLVNTSDGDVDEQLFTVRGVFSTGIPGYDEATVFMPIAKAQAITRAENHASTIFVLLHDREQTDAVASALQSSRYEVKTWVQMNELIVETEKFSGAYLEVLYLIILMITATVIINTLIMSVFERTREIGILSAMGMKSFHIMAMFFAESSLLAVGGILIGLVLGGLMVAYATYVGFYIGNMGITGMLMGERIYAYLTLENTLNLTITAFIVSLLAALYPAILAARMEPVEALRGGK